MDVVAQMLSAFLNDPGDKKEAPVVIAPGASRARFTIKGGVPQGGPFKPGSQEFQAGHLLIILTFAYDTWAKYFSANFDWEPGKALPVVPRAGQDLNAYYDRTALKFFYATDPKTKATVYACESGEVVAHECGHAILDAHHPDYWDSLHPETGAFHEAFGDICALLTTLQFPTVRAQVLKDTEGDLGKDSIITRLAEQLAKAIYDEYGNQASSPRYLRDLINSFRYKETYLLPAKAPASKLSSESHSFSRIFSGAFYQILVGIYDQKRKADAKLPEDDALVQARDDAGYLLASALLLAPPGDAVYRVIATSMLKAEQQRFAGAYFGILRDVFAQRHILKAQDANAFQPHTLAGAGKVQPIKPGLLSIGDSPPDQLDPAMLQREWHMQSQDLAFSRELAPVDNTRIVQYRAEKMVVLKGKQYGAANGVSIPIQSGLTLSVSSAGSVESSNGYASGPDELRAVKNHVEKLAERDKIYDTRPGDDVNITHLITRKQPYYVDYDDQGRKVLRRAFIACDCGRHHIK